MDDIWAADTCINDLFDFLWEFVSAPLFVQCDTPEKKLMQTRDVNN